MNSRILLRMFRALVVAAAFSCGPGAFAGTLLIENVTLIDGTGHPPGPPGQHRTRRGGGPRATSRSGPGSPRRARTGYSQAHVRGARLGRTAHDPHHVRGPDAAHHP